jgi:hypothetical protein
VEWRSHASSFFGADIYPKMTGSHAVQAFYIISGFLIALILSGKYANTARGSFVAYAVVAASIGSVIAINHVLVYPLDVWRQRQRKIAYVRDPSKPNRMAVA